jgi:enoyl-CoA hydratase
MSIQELGLTIVAEAYRNNFLGSWGKLASIQKPIIGAVAGFAVCLLFPLSVPRLTQKLGGGCELALMTDILITTPDAKFGQPEITLGIIPGGGGTQRLASVIGKARTMDLVLTNRWITGTEAAEWGLASRVTKEGESVVDEAVKVGDVIAGFGAVATQAGKEAVNAGESTSHVRASVQGAADCREGG